MFGGWGLGGPTMNIPIPFHMFSEKGYIPNSGGVGVELRIHIEFPYRYQRNSMQNFQGSMKNEVEFPGVK